MRTEASVVKIKILTTVHCSEGKQENVDTQTKNIPFPPLFMHFKIYGELYWNLPLQLT